MFNKTDAARKLIVAALAVVFICAGCSKYIKPSDKAAYSSATAAVDKAEKDLKSAEASPNKDNMQETYNDARSKLAGAKEYLSKDDYAGAQDSAEKASLLARDVKELPGEVQKLIAETEKSLVFATEVGLDRSYGKKIKEIKDTLWDANNNVRLRRFAAAKSMAANAYNETRKAIEDVEKANDSMAKAKTAVIDAKDAGAESTVADILKSAEDALAMAKLDMDNANFQKAREGADKACQLAKDALEKAKAVKQK